MNILKSRYQLNNKGLSLVELIVVIAIMAVMLGAGGFTLSMLSSAEAKQGIQKMVAQLNDVKTGTMTKASEELVVRYIEVTDSNKEAWTKVGVDKTGYYADKCIYTIMNKPGSVKTPYNDKHEYSFICSGKVEIKVNGTYKLEKADSTAVRLTFNRRTGELEPVETGSISSDTFSGSPAGEIKNMTFKCGLRTYTLTFDAKAGRYEIE